MSENKISERAAETKFGPRPPAFPENTISAPSYGNDCLDMIALLAAVMERYKDVPDDDLRPCLQWFARKYGTGER